VLVVVLSGSLLNLFPGTGKLGFWVLNDFFADLEFVGCCMIYMIVMNV